MDVEIKSLWVKALRSGDYEQGKGQLRTESNKFCCLGVLCNIHAQAHPEIAAKQTKVDRYFDQGCFLDYRVYEWARVDMNPYVTVGNHYDTLSWHNDNGATFRQIADAIEEQL